jgi:hypothetical protein
MFVLKVSGKLKLRMNDCLQAKRTMLLVLRTCYQYHATLPQTRLSTQDHAVTISENVLTQAEVSK